MGGGDGAEGADMSAPAMVHSFQGWVKEEGVVGPLPFLVGCGGGRQLWKRPGAAASQLCLHRSHRLMAWTSDSTVSLGLLSQGFYFSTTPFLRPAPRFCFTN